MRIEGRYLWGKTSPWSKTPKSRVTVSQSFSDFLSDKMCSMQFPIHRSIIIAKHVAVTLFLIFAFIVFIVALTKPRHPHAPSGIDTIAWILFGIWFMNNAFGWASVLTLNLCLLYTYLTILLLDLIAITFAVSSTQNIWTIVVLIVTFAELILYILLIHRVRKNRSSSIVSAPTIYYSP